MYIRKLQNFVVMTVIARVREKTLSKPVFKLFLKYRYFYKNIDYLKNCLVGIINILL